MESSLLATKRQIPALPVHAVSRSRLIEILERSLLHCKLIRIAAPAGYGKTTLLSQWARTSRYPVAWFTVEEADNDPERFFRYLLAAWGTTQPDVMQSQLGILLSAMAPDMAAVQAAFVNVANDISRHTAVVLDDYHLIDNPILHNTIAFLLDHIPPKLHFVLAGRGEPPLPLARYRAMGAMLELQTRELRFLPEEANTFLNQEMGLDLTLQDVGQLQEKLEGWIVSLQLVALSMKQGLLQTNELVVSGRQRFIADYLHEDVLNHLPEDSRQFLLQTSILDRLCGSLCTAVTDHTNAQQMLETLEQEDLFLVPLDDKREWFRYHHLFADFLQEALKQRDEDTAVLHRRAARWYLTHDLPEQAYRHALAGDDVELVIRVFERYVQPMLIGGELKSLNRWLESLPETWHADHPIIDLFQTGFLLFTGQLEASLRHVELVEHLIQTRRVRVDVDHIGCDKATRFFESCDLLGVALQNVLVRGLCANSRFDFPFFVPNAERCQKLAYFSHIGDTSVFGRDRNTGHCCHLLFLRLNSQYPVAICLCPYTQPASHRLEHKLQDLNVT